MDGGIASIECECKYQGNRTQIVNMVVAVVV